MPSLLSDAQLTQILRKAAGVAFRLDQETARAKDKPQLSLLLDARLTVNDLLALVDQLRQERDELSLTNEASEDQARQLENESYYNNLELVDLRASCSRLRRALATKIHGRMAASQEEANKYAAVRDEVMTSYHHGCVGLALCLLEDLAALSVRDDGPKEDTVKG